MKVLVLGGNGFIGRAIVDQLSRSDWAEPVVASRSAGVDSRDEAALTRALGGMDAVINCVAGEGASIAEGAACLTRAALAAGRVRLVHLSTMSVYGRSEGLVSESHAQVDDLGWYGHAKIAAEAHMQRYREAGGDVVMLRPGCVVGAGSVAWVGRMAQWLAAGRIGDLGPWGDGPANLVDVVDVAQAAVAALRYAVPQGTAPAFNLAAPDSPRWNDYFCDLALAIGATPLKRLGARQLKFEALVKGVPLKVAERVMSRLKLDTSGLPPGIPPSLLGLWRQQIELDSSAATRDLGVRWTPYADTLAHSARWAVAQGFRRA